MNKKIKKAFVLLAVIVLIAFCPINVHAEEIVDSDAVIQVPQEWEDVVQNAPVTAEQFKQMTLPDMILALFESAKEYFLSPIRLFAQLCAVLILVATVKGFSSETMQGNVIVLLDTVATLAVFTLCSGQILKLMQILQTALEESKMYIASFIPVFSSVMVACGQVGSSLVYSGMFFAVVTLSAQLLVSVGLPITRVLIALHATAIVDSVLDLTKLARSFTKWIKWVLTALATLFAAVLSLQTVLAQSADSAALKAGKFLIGTSVPVVGRAVSDAMGSVLAGMKLIKGSVGFAAVAVIAATFLPLLLQCISFHMVFTFGSIIASATSNSKAEKLLDGFTDCIGLYITITLFFAMMMIATTLMMVIVGGGA